MGGGGEGAGRRAPGFPEKERLKSPRRLSSACEARAFLPSLVPAAVAARALCAHRCGFSSPLPTARRGSARQGAQPGLKRGSGVWGGRGRRRGAGARPQGRQAEGHQSRVHRPGRPETRGADRAGRRELGSFEDEKLGPVPHSVSPPAGPGPGERGHSSTLRFRRRLPGVRGCAPARTAGRPSVVPGRRRLVRGVGLGTECFHGGWGTPVVCALLQPVLPPGRGRGPRPGGKSSSRSGVRRLFPGKGLDAPTPPAAEVAAGRVGEAALWPPSLAPP